MKKLYILSLFFIMLFSSTSFSQWWQKGGDLIWPYGDVNITQGSLLLDSGDIIVNNRYLSKPRYIIGYLTFNKADDELTMNVYRNDFGSVDSVQFDGSGNLYLYFNSPSYDFSNNSYAGYSIISFSSADSGNTFLHTTSFLTSSSPNKILFQFFDIDNGSYYSSSAAELYFLFFEYPKSSPYLNSSSYFRTGLQ